MAEQSATLSAKQVATKLGTDAKTFRRFLRSNACTVEPVGQGGRYEFNGKDVEALKNQFVAWRKPGSSNGAAAKPTSTKRMKTEKPADPPKRRKHRIDDDPPEIRLFSSIAERQRAADMANAIEKDFTEEDFDRGSDEEPTDEELAELADELDDLALEDIDD